MLNILLGLGKLELGTEFLWGNVSENGHWNTKKQMK